MCIQHENWEQTAEFMAQQGENRPYAWQFITTLTSNDICHCQKPENITMKTLFKKLSNAN